MTNTRSKGRIITLVVAVALVLSLGTVGALAATNSGAWHEVTPEEYEAIKAGKIKLDDGVPRFWNGGVGSEVFEITEGSPERNTPKAEFEITLTATDSDGWHKVTPEEYEAIKAGEIKLDDGVPRYWNGGVGLEVFDFAEDGPERNMSAEQFEITLHGTATFVSE